MREKVDIQLTAAQKRYKYNHDKSVRKTTVLKTKELVLIYMPPLVVNTNSSKTTDIPTNNKLLLRADAPYRIISVRQHTLTFVESGVPSTTPVDPATPAPSHNTNIDAGDECDAIGSERATI